MSTGMVTTDRGRGMTSSNAATPERALTVGIASEQQRAIAEVQSALMVAAARPRDERAAIDRIRTACGRQYLAEHAEYQYARGETNICGPSIRLLECIAGAWQNLTFGFRVLSQNEKSSTVEAFAWDLETNTKRVVNFEVPHLRVTRSTRTMLTDPRDIYELIANSAQRRVRSCLEAVIPRDVVEDAVQECHKTLQNKCPLTPDAVKKMIECFAAIGVKKEQLEARLQRRMDAITPAQFATFRRIYVSLKDGLSEAKDWFPVAGDNRQQIDGTKSEGLAAALSGRTESQHEEPVEDEPASEPEPVAERLPKPGDAAGPFDWALWELQELKTAKELADWTPKYFGKHSPLVPEEVAKLKPLAAARKAELS